MTDESTNNSVKTLAAETPPLADPPVPPPQADPPPQTSDASSYLEKVVMYIPATINAAYVAALGLLHEQPVHPAWLHWAVFLLLFVLTPFYSVCLPGQQLKTDTNMKFNALTATIAFAVWVYAIDGGPIAVSYPDFYRPLYGSLLLIATTLVLPILEKLACKTEFFRKKK